ncbi:MAG TPA: zinc dependent phospholipase C family protein [Candidatus Acidoferrales bacterium]
MLRRFLSSVCALLMVSGFFSPGAVAYAVLAHEAVIDSCWESGIRPLLLQRFPGSTHDELRQAHGYAYGGAIIQDLGYYPHGSHLFSDLVHYVRSADFVEALLRDSKDLNEYAFALGALAHYCADNNGHRIAVNRVVPMLYPKLRQKYGDVVTYDENPAAHLKTEFGFDVLEVARQHYASDAYHDFIGFEVAKPLLEHAFRDTYSIELQSVFSDFDKSVNSYRYDVSKLIPKATRLAWQTKKNDIQKELPTATRNEFVYRMSRSSFEKNWGKTYEKPGLGTRILAFLFRIIPKIGPLKTLDFKTPTPQAENMFMASFNAAVDEYTHDLKGVPSGLNLPNTNLDTGGSVEPGKYPLADDTYADLLDRLDKNQFRDISPGLRANILDYYADTNAAYATKKHSKQWARVLQEINQIKTAPAPAQAGQVVSPSSPSDFAPLPNSLEWAGQTSAASSASSVVAR